jgi:hypothetical protein
MRKIDRLAAANRRGRAGEGKKPSLADSPSRESKQIVSRFGDQLSRAVKRLASQRGAGIDNELAGERCATRRGKFGRRKMATTQRESQTPGPEPGPPSGGKGSFPDPSTRRIHGANLGKVGNSCPESSAREGRTLSQRWSRSWLSSRERAEGGDCDELTGGSGTSGIRVGSKWPGFREHPYSKSLFPFGAKPPQGDEGAPSAWRQNAGTPSQADQ